MKVIFEGTAEEVKTDILAFLGFTTEERKTGSYKEAWNDIQTRTQELILYIKKKGSVSQSELGNPQTIGGLIANSSRNANKHNLPIPIIRHGQRTDVNGFIYTLNQEWQDFLANHR